MQKDILDKEIKALADDIAGNSYKKTDFEKSAKPASQLLVSAEKVDKAYRTLVDILPRGSNARIRIALRKLIDELEYLYAEV